LVENGKVLEVEQGEILIAENVLQDGFYIILDGAFEILRQAGDQEVVLTVQKSGQMLGEMSIIANLPPTATVRAACPCQVFMISREVFNQLLTQNPSIVMELLRTAMLRLRNTETMLNQNEKLASLGNLAAGLAHELNNPAAAARRSIGQLRQAIGDWLQARCELDDLALGQSLNQTILTRLTTDVASPKRHTSIGDALVRSEREMELEDWLSAQGMQDSWKYASTLVDSGWTPDGLKSWCSPFNPAHLPVILRWLTIGYDVHTLINEIDHSTERISAIVTAVKSYTHLDQAPKKLVDIHEGLETTLMILKHKLAQDMLVQRDFDPSLPPLEAYASELNQVWTNLIDNALDAMGGVGVLRLRTYQRDNSVVVEIGDNGPGIPANVIGNVFEPFYTTKGPGKGTGLGLYVSYGIIKKHDGKITVESQPGDTRFIVSIPFRLEG
jgi:signal transduction histidine kinase